MNHSAKAVSQLLVVGLTIAGAALCVAVQRANAQAQPPQPEVNWGFAATEWRGQHGKTFSVFCPPATVRGGAVWGVDIYTDDSSLCMAAMHALTTFDHRTGGTVFFQMEPAQEGFDAELRRGIQSEQYGPFGGAMRILAAVPGKRLSEIGDSTPIEIAWSSTARHLRGKAGVTRTVLCPRGGAPSPVWGTNMYADDSSICTAAVHAGLINFRDGGSVTLRTEVGIEGYRGTAKNGVRSLPWEMFDGSFSFPGRQIAVALPAPGADALPAPARPPAAVAAAPRASIPVLQPSGEYVMEWSTSADSWAGRANTIITAFCPPGGQLLRIWGSGDYTSDSSVCTAAVHALTSFDFARGGTVYVRMTPGLATYESEQRRGVPSSAWAVFSNSFRIVGGVPGKRPNEIGDTTSIEISWSATAEHLRGVPREYRMVCPAVGRAFQVWGTDVYSDDSSICGAALHSGLITMDAGGPLTLRIETGRTGYEGTARNGVTTQSVARAPGSFSVRRQ